MSDSLYDRDFCAWANEQAALLRAERLSEADIENIAEEIQSMERGEKLNEDPSLRAQLEPARSSLFLRSGHEA